MGLGLLVDANPVDGDDVWGSVQLAVALAMQAVANGQF
jgi:hypothetical protein